MRERESRHFNDESTSKANELVMNTLLEKEDEVITVVPGYQQFVDIPRSIGLVLRQEKGLIK